MRSIPLGVAVSRWDRFYLWLAQLLPERLVWCCGLLILQERAEEVPFTPVDRITAMTALRTWAGRR